MSSPVCRHLRGQPRLTHGRRNSLPSVVPLLPSLGVQSAIVSAVVDTLRAANVPGTNSAKPPPVVATVPPLPEVNLHAADADPEAAKRRLLDAATTDEIAAMLAHLMKKKQAEPGEKK